MEIDVENGRERMTFGGLDIDVLFMLRDTDSDVYLKVSKNHAVSLEDQERVEFDVSDECSPCRITGVTVELID